MTSSLRPAIQLMSTIALLCVTAAILGHGIASDRVPALPAIAIAISACAAIVVWGRIRSDYPLAVGVMLVMTVPYWYTLGSAQAGMVRVAALAALLTVLLARKARLAVVDFTVAAVVGVAVLGWLLQDDQPGVGKIVLNSMLPLMFYAAARGVNSDRVHRIMVVVAAAGTVGAGTVIYEFLIGHVAFVIPSMYQWNPPGVGGLFRPGGIFGSPPGAATVLAMAILCGVPLSPRPGWGRVAYGVSLAIMVTACVLTFTRASLIGLCVGVLSYTWLMRSRLITPGRLILAGIVLFGALVIVLPRIEPSRTFQEGVVRPGNLAARESYWRLALPIITESPHNVVFGIGFGRTVIPRYGGAMSFALATSPELVEHGTHNEYVMTLLEEGLVGFAALMAWIVATISTGLKTVWSTHDRVSAALVGAMAAFAVTMLANNALLHPPSFEIAALVSGLVVARSMAEKRVTNE
jgi:hypothetical protein